MELVTLREYAKQQGVTYEAIRRQTHKYAEELAGHIIIKDRIKYLDETAQAFLLERRKASPIVLATMNQDEEIQQLQEQVKVLQGKLFEQQERIITLTEESKAMLEVKVRYEMLLTDSSKQKEKLEELQKEADEARRERDAAQAEASSFQRSIFGFYRKR